MTEQEARDAALDAEERSLGMRQNEKARGASDAWMVVRGIRTAERAVRGAAAAAGQRVPLWVTLALTNEETAAEAAYAYAVSEETSARLLLKAHIDRRIDDAMAGAVALADGQVAL